MVADVPLVEYTETSSVADSDLSDNSPIVIPYGSKETKTSFAQILIHLFKSNCGVGLLNMPFNLAKAGIILGPILSLLFIFPVIYATFTLLKCSREIKRRTGKATIGYAGTFRYSMIEHIQSRARYLVYTVNFFLIVSQLGICIVYIIFTAETIQEVTEGYFSDERILIIIIGCTILLPSMISNLEAMSILSGSATIFSLFSLAITFYYIICDLKISQKYTYVGNFSVMPSFFSTLLYAYEGINVVVPLDNEIENPAMYPLALKIATSGTTFLYFTVGLLGYIAYGENTKRSITFNLPFGLFSNTIKILYALGVILTFFIQFHVAMRALLPTITKRVSNKNTLTFLTYGMRTFFVILITLFAIVIPHLDQAIELIGAFGCTALGLIFPSIIHLATYWKYTDENKITRLRILIDSFMIIFGVMLCVGGVYTSIQSINAAYHSNKS